MFRLSNLCSIESSFILLSLFLCLSDIAFAYLVAHVVHRCLLIN